MLDLLYVTDPESIYNVVWNWTHEEHILIEGFCSLISVNIELGWPVIIPPKQYAVLLLYMPCKKKKKRFIEWIVKSGHGSTMINETNQDGIE